MSRFLHHVLYPCLNKVGFFRLLTSRSGNLRIVTYHGVLSPSYKSRFPGLDGNFVTPEQLRQQLFDLKRDFDVVSPADVRAWLRGDTGLPRRALLLTCDDGLANHSALMLEILREASLRAIFFCTTDFSTETPHRLWHEELYALLASAAEQGRLSTALRDQIGPANLNDRWWGMVRKFGGLPARERRVEIEALAAEIGVSVPSLFAFSDADQRFRLLTKAELQHLHRSGMTVGSHCMSHPLLAAMTREDAAFELANSRAVLQEILQEDVWAVSYPFGGRDDAGLREWELARQAGYEFGVMNIPAGSAQPLAWGRVNAGSGSSRATLNAHLSGFHARLQRFARRGE